MVKMILTVFGLLFLVFLSWLAGFRSGKSKGVRNISTALAMWDSLPNEMRPEGMDVKIDKGHPKFIVYTIKVVRKDL